MAQLSTSRSDSTPAATVKWWRAWLICGGALVASMLILTAVSPLLNMPITDVSLGVPLLAFVEFYILANLIYLLAVAIIKDAPPGRNPLIAMLAIGAVMRLIACFSSPILENDYHRYLWDGAVTAGGHNPWRFSPQRIMDAADGDVPVDIQKLARRSPQTLERINHPQVRSVYPPVAQAAFAAAHAIRPWRTGAWRAVLLIADAATLVLLLMLLRSLTRPLLWAAVWWWSPLAVKETVNSLHMDLIALPLVLGGTLLAVRGLRVTAIVPFAAAIGAKIWPLILVPFAYRGRLMTRRRAALAGVLLLALLAPMAAWVLAAGVDEQSGIVVYARDWYNNSALYAGLSAILNPLAAVIGPGATHLILRCMPAVGMIAWLGYLLRTPIDSSEDFVRRCTLAVAGLFLLSPAQFPWYFQWLLPLLALRMYLPLIWYVVLLPLYYLTYHWPAVIWLEHLPVWAIIGWAALKQRSKKS